MKNISGIASHRRFFMLLLLAYFFNNQLFGQAVLSSQKLNYLRQSTDAEFSEKVRIIYDSVHRFCDISDKTSISAQLFELTKKKGGYAHMYSLLFKKMHTLHSEEGGLFAKAYQLAEESGDFDAMCLVEYSRANFFIERKQYDSAMVYLLNYRDMTPEDMKGEGYRNIINLIGDIYYNAGLYDQAAAVYESLYNEYLTENNWGFYRPYVMMNNLGQIALKTGKTELAGSWFRLSLQRAMEHLHTTYRVNIIAYIQVKLAETAIQMGNLEDAACFLQKIDSLPTEQIRNDVWMDYYWQRASLLFKQQDYDAALKGVNKFIDIGRKNGMIRQYDPEVYQMLSEIYHAQGDYRNAMENSRKYIEKADSVKSMEHLAQSMIILSDRNHARTKAELQRAQTRYSILLVGAAMVTLFLLITLWIMNKLQGSKLALVRKSLEQNKKEEIVNEINRPDNGNNNAQVSENTVREKELVRRLKALMDKEKPYLDPKTGIVNISKQLSTNRTYLSQAVNSQLDTSFPNFINEYRIKEAVRLITSGYTDGYTQEALAKKVGFSSRSVFISAFKKVTGVVPSFFIANHKKLQEGLA